MRNIDPAKTLKRKRSESIKETVRLYVLFVTVYIEAQLTLVSASYGIDVVYSPVKKSPLKSHIYIRTA